MVKRRLIMKSKVHLENWKPPLPICKFVSYVKKSIQQLWIRQREDSPPFHFNLSPASQSHKRRFHSRAVSSFDFSIYSWWRPRPWEMTCDWLVGFCPDAKYMIFVVETRTPRIMDLSPWRTLTSLGSNLVTSFPNFFFADHKQFPNARLPSWWFSYSGVKSHLLCVHSVFLHESCLPSKKCTFWHLYGENNFNSLSLIESPTLFLAGIREKGDWKVSIAYWCWVFNHACLDYVKPNWRKV